MQEGREILGGKSSDACDHDHIPLHITPSVINIFDTPPRRLEDGFFGGKTTVLLKDAVFEPSSASRHMVELSHADTSPKSSPINLIYTDGGGDHRTPFISVQISYICRWIEQDLDMLVAPRTPPYLSVLNPIERIHSTLNFGLTGMTLARKQLDDDTERKIKSLSSKKEWRKHNEEFLKGNENKVDCRKVIENTTKDCHEMIKKSFRHCNTKEKEYKLGKNQNQQIWNNS